MLVQVVVKNGVGDGMSQAPFATLMRRNVGWNASEVDCKIRCDLRPLHRLGR